LSAQNFTVRGYLAIWGFLNQMAVFAPVNGTPVGNSNLEPAQGGNWDWVQTVLSGCPIAKEAAIPTPCLIQSSAT